MEVSDVGRRKAEAAAIESEMAEVCGTLNVATARLVRLIGRVLETEAWQGFGIRSAEQWVAWKCGVSPRRARTLVMMARRLGELPETRSAFDNGALAEDSVEVICRLAPTAVDADVSELAQNTTVTQLRRVLSEYSPPDKTAADPPQEERRDVSFGHTDRGSWRLSAELPPDEGAVVEKALTAMRDELFQAGEAGHGPSPAAADVSWADAFVAMAEASLTADAVKHPHRDRSMVLLHVGADQRGHLHLGPGLTEGLRRYIAGDSRVQPVFESAGKPVSVGRAFRTVPDRTRVVVEERDHGCRVPGCDRSRWLHVHHIEHWEDGGATDTPNLLCLCQHHHRLHHRGKLGIRGDADEPNGIIFTDDRGRPLESCGRPTPPRNVAPPRGSWVPPSGERLDPWAIERARPAERRLRRVMPVAGAWETMLRHQAEHAGQPLSRHRLLLAHLDYAWDRARPAMDGLTDEEYFWEPVPECWTVRRRPDGTFMPDWASPEPSPAPFTTIAWRATHVAFAVHMRASHRFAEGSLSALNAPWPGSAEAALTWLDDGFRAYRAGVETLADQDLDVPPPGPPGYVDTRFPLAMTVQHVTLELIHHGAEISLLRDLYRCSGAGSMATASGNESASNVGE